MSGLYNPNFSPARAASPQIRSTPDFDRYYCLFLSFNFLSFYQSISQVLIFMCHISNHYLSELLAEHQKLGPFVQVLPICSRLLNQGYSFYHFLVLDLPFFGFSFIFTNLDPTQFESFYIFIYPSALQFKLTELQFFCISQTC